MESFAFAYLDDIVIVIPMFEEHMIWLKNYPCRSYREPRQVQILPFAL